MRTKKENHTQSFESVTEKEELFTVVFKDYNGTVLKTEKVKKYGSATAPEIPKREGYKFIKWDTYYKNVRVDIIVTAIYEKITLPTFVVDKMAGNPGDMVAVKVNVKNNPGILSVLLNIEYDENAIRLTKVQNGSLLNGYMFIPPKNMKSGCNAAWSVTEIPDGTENGEIAILHFEVSKKAKAGTYPITVSCLNNAFDDKYNIVTFETINGAIVIE